MLERSSTSGGEMAVRGGRRRAIRIIDVDACRAHPAVNLTESETVRADEAVLTELVRSPIRPED